MIKKVINDNLQQFFFLDSNHIKSYFLIFIFEKALYWVIFLLDILDSQSVIQTSNEWSNEWLRYNYVVIFDIINKYK